MPLPYTTQPGLGGKTLCLSGTTWETAAGFSRDEVEKLFLKLA